MLHLRIVDMDKNARNEKKGSRSSTPHERSTPNTGRNAPNPAAIQQLQFQQQQLISQLQLVQQKILMVSEYIEAYVEAYYGKSIIYYENEVTIILL